MRFFFFILFLLTCQNQKVSPSASATAAALPDTVQPISIEYITGKFEPRFHADFTLIDKKYASRDSMLLRKEAYEAFRRMHWAAEKAGIKLTIISATRNFKYQKNIWERKWASLQKTVKDPVERARRIMQYSAMPSASRHHWGTDIDIDDVSNTYFEKGQGKKIYDWLTENAAQFGFCQPYTAGRVTGYFEEKWHWTYLPLSKDFTAFAEKNLKNEKITGFKGAETAVAIDVVTHYVLAINKACF
jgi:LAS superfamily LD-carboxypeptidase LdcB